MKIDMKSPDCSQFLAALMGILEVVICLAKSIFIDLYTVYCSVHEMLEYLLHSDEHKCIFYF